MTVHNNGCKSGKHFRVYLYENLSKHASGIENSNVSFSTYFRCVVVCVVAVVGNVSTSQKRHYPFMFLPSFFHLLFVLILLCT